MYTEFFESGFVPIPTTQKNKSPVKDAAGFNIWAVDGIPESQIELFERKYPLDKGYGIAIVCGPKSNICVVDIDTDDKEVIAACPQSPVSRRGKKGEARFFKYNPEIRNQTFARKIIKDGKKVIDANVDILVEKKYIIIPPSIHVDTGKPYRWLTPFDLLSGFDDLVELMPSMLDEMARVLGHDSYEAESSSSVELSGEWSSPDQTRAPHGSYNRLKAIAHGLISECTPIEQAVSNLIKYDRDHHRGVPYFEDKRRHSDFGADPYSNAARLYCNFLKTSNEQRIRQKKTAQVPDQLKEIDVSELLSKKPQTELVFKPYPKPRGAMALFNEYCELMGKGRQDALALGGGLTLMAAVCSNRFQTNVRGLAVWPNLYVLNLGYSGFGKDASQRLADDLLCDTNLVGSANYKSGTSMVQTLPKQQERIDLIDECSWLLKSMHQGENFQSEMVEILSLLFSRSSSRFNGIASAKEGERYGAAWQPCVNILASTTPAGFKESVNKAMAAKGLMPRFLTFFQKEIGEYKGQQDISKANQVKAELQAWVNRMVSLEKTLHKDFEPPRNYLAPGNRKDHKDLSMGNRYDPFLVRMSDEAHARWLAYEEKNHVLAAKNPDSFESAFYGRFAEIAAKLSLLDTISQMSVEPMVLTSELQVHTDNIEWAIEVIEVCWHNSQPLYEQATAETWFERDTTRVLTIIKESGGLISSRDLSRRTQWLQPEQRARILKGLAATDKVEETTDKNAKGKRCPKTTLYVLKTDIEESNEINL